MSDSATDTPRFITAKQLCERYAFVRIGGLRDWIFHDFRGFRTKCVRKIGPRKLLISVPDFEAWIDRQGADSHTQPSQRAA